VTEKGLRPRMREQVLADAVAVRDHRARLQDMVGATEASAVITTPATRTAGGARVCK
jgi:hypothetical protein